MLQRSVLNPAASAAIPSLELYKVLFFARRCEEYIIKHYSEDLMRTPMHMSFGQEFIPVGVCRALEGSGDVFSSYRSHAAFLAQTLDSDLFFGELYGRITGTADGKGGSMHLSATGKGHLLASGIVASTIPVAVGTAFANKRLKTGRTAVVFFGDGAVDEGGFWESVNAASVFHLPVFFVCEDNGWAVHTPPSAHQGYSSLADIGKLFDCYFFADDSNDVERVYAITREAVAKVAEEPRPVLMHIKCCRYLEHVGIFEDWNLGYRGEAERRTWQDRDSLRMQRARLMQQGHSDVAIDEIEREIDERVRRSVESAAQSPVPSPDRLHHGVFHEKD
jgi:acetoin:2,6-dichlorophenolindophenol oxidoreductase subunit alpha